MRFLNADLGWWLAAAGAALLMFRWLGRRRFAASNTVPWIARASRPSIFRRLPFLLLAAGLALIAVALMDPVLPYSEATVKSRGLDIVIVLDLSSSMQQDMEHTFRIPTLTNRNRPGVMRQPKMRLVAVKEAVTQFVSRRRDDRLGLVVFSDHAYVISPLTIDHDYLLRYIEMVNNEILSGEGMTAIGDGVALANYLLDKQSPAGQDSRNRVIVLFTDGENNRGRDPTDVLTESDAAAIRVHMVGVDLEEELRKKASVQRLVDAVRRNGGRYFNANTVRDLETASRTIDSLEKGSLVSKVYNRDLPVYHWFAIPALLLLFGSMALGAVPYFVDQT